ncbi:hypothetical protein BH24ACT10_BH24ACT10_16070 [soil metagenome]
MSRHDRDSLSLMAGLLLLLVGGAYLLDDLTAIRVDGDWVLPVGLVVIGALGLLSSLRSVRPPAEP